jgi:hypothetical protein
VRPVAAGERRGDERRGNPRIRCRSIPRLAVLEYPKARPPGYARSWQLHHLPGIRIVRLVGYQASR